MRTSHLSKQLGLIDGEIQTTYEGFNQTLTRSSGVGDRHFFDQAGIVSELITFAFQELPLS